VAPAFAMNLALGTKAPSILEIACNDRSDAYRRPDLV
jgi:hypothetical protein